MYRVYIIIKNIILNFEKVIAVFGSNAPLKKY